MKTSDFDYTLPIGLIAQTPIEPRDHSRLMVLSREDGSLAHHRFFELVDYLMPGDVLVCNNSRVLPARLLGHKADGGAKVEVLLLRRLDASIWETLVRPGRRLGVGARLEIGGGAKASLWAEVVARTEMGTRIIRFSDEAMLEELGTVPLPPYIRAPLDSPERYQTIYASVKGSVAAPTAGLHFTPGLMARIQEQGVSFAFVTLHIGLDSFRPVQVEDPRNHPLHREYCELTPEVADELAQAKAQGRRIIPVGTTALRVLEEAARLGAGTIKPFSGWTDLYILPGHHFQAADALITNFHLPRSTLLMLVSAFAGGELIRHAYDEAIRLDYRFYSFGDCMLIK